VYTKRYVFNFHERIISQGRWEINV